MRLPCGCKVGELRGRILLACLRSGRIRLFDLIHGNVNRRQAMIDRIRQTRRVFECA